MILIRVDDSWDCERLRAERDELFPPTPEVDWSTDDPLGRPHRRVLVVTPGEQSSRSK